MAKEYFEIRKFEEIGTGLGFPEELNRGLEKEPKLIMLDPYGFLFPYGDTSKKPPVYFHHAYLNKIRFNGVTELGDDYLSHQKPGKHHDEMAQPDTPVTKIYERFDDGLKGYVIQTDKPFSQIKHYDDGTVVCKEGDFLDITFKPLKFANVDYGCMFPGRFQVQQPCLLSGFYEGEPVIGMGSYDRIWAPSEVFNSLDIMSESAYIYVVGHGVREDGRKESYIITIGLYGNETKIQNGYYWIDGEEPVVVDNARIEAEWEYLTYVDDGTMVYKDATFYIGNKVIHFNGKWGTKGYTKEPRIERHGQSQIYGTWYEGDTPYNHKMYFAWGEHTGTYDYVIEKCGYKIKK